MTIEQPPQDESESGPPEKGGDAHAFAGESRRRFTKAGLAASGVLMTLASRQGLACTAVSPSGFTSMNQSRHSTGTPSCGLTPGFWKNHDSWPSPVTQTTLFRNIFSVSNPSSPYYTITFQEILSPPQHFDQNNNQIGYFLAAAYLNALAGLTPYLTASTIVNIWHEWSTLGYYVPIAPIHWDSAHIAAYLQATMN